MIAPEGATIEIVERRTRVPSGGIGAEIVVPTEVRLNGTPLLTVPDHPVKIHEVEIPGESLVLVTLTLIAKRIVVGHEGPEVPA